MAEPKLSLVVPAYNEERRVGASLATIASFLRTLPYPSEVIIVDDGSESAGRQAAEAAVAALPPAIGSRLLRHEKNRGKGAAVRTGALAARGEYIAFLDADLATPPEELTLLVAALDAGADVAIGIRRQADGSDMRSRRGLPRRLAGAGFSLFMQAVLLPGVVDSQCPLKAFRRATAQRLFRLQRIDTWSFDAELLYLARRLNLEVRQVPVRWKAVGGSHLRLDFRTATELANLVRVRFAHRAVSPGTLAADAPEPLPSTGP